MKNQKQIKKIISIILVAIIALTANVYAANDSYKTTLSASKTEIKSGDSITITIGLKDISIESGEKGIGAYTAALEFDNSVFEVPSDAAKPASGWEFMCNEGTQGLLLIGNTANGEVIDTDQPVGTITLKVKDGAKSGETKIGLTNFSAATLGEEEASTTDNYLTLNVIGDEPNPVPDPEPGNKQNEVVNPGNIPNTGHNDVIKIVLLGITAVIVISVFVVPKFLHPNKK